MTHKELRSAVVQFLTTHQEAYLDFFSDGESYDSYIQQIALPGAWGDNLTLMIIAELLQSPIHVAQNHGVQIIAPSMPIGQPIWIAYNGYSHYD